ncbi:hypothetical protein D3C84_653280 [compost metagenome]
MIKRAGPRPEPRTETGHKQVQTDRGRLAPTDPRRLTEAKALTETLGRASSPGNSPLRQISVERGKRKRVKPRKNGRRPVRAVPATMHSPTRAHRPGPAPMPVVAGPARPPPSAPVPRARPVTRSVGRPIHQHVNGGVAVVEKQSWSEGTHRLTPAYPCDRCRLGLVVHCNGRAGISNAREGRSSVRRSTGYRTRRSGTPDRIAGQ